MRWYIESVVSPKVEIWIPKKLDEEDLRIKIAELGGRILNFRRWSEVQPVKVNEVFPGILADFLGEQDPNLQFDHPTNYSIIFSLLHSLSPQKQEELLRGFFTNGVEGFPNGERLGAALAEINNIPWFKPKKKPETASLQILIDKHRSRLNLPPLPVRIIEDYWTKAWREVREGEWSIARGRGKRTHGRDAWGAAWGAAWDAVGTARGKAEGATWDAAHGAAWDAERVAKIMGQAGRPRWDSAWGAAWYATWVVVEDLMPPKGYTQGNPFEPLMEIYKAGCWPIGEYKGMDAEENYVIKEEFVIFVPPFKQPHSRA